MELPKVKIGGEEIALLAIMNFATLKRAWPALQAIDEAPKAIDKVSAGARLHRRCAAADAARADARADGSDRGIRSGGRLTETAGESLSSADHGLINDHAGT